MNNNQEIKYIPREIINDLVSELVSTLQHHRSSKNIDNNSYILSPSTSHTIQSISSNVITQSTFVSVQTTTSTTLTSSLPLLVSEIEVIKSNTTTSSTVSTIIQGNNHSNSNKDGDNQYLIIDMVKRENHEERIIHQETKENTTIWQLRVLKQIKNDSCGYYSLFNGISIYRSASYQTQQPLNQKEEKDEENKDNSNGYKFIKDMLSRPLFWHVYEVSLRLLIKKAKESKKTYYPWTEKYIRKGVLERCYIEHLLSTDNIISRGKYPLTVLPDWAIDSLRNNRLPLEEVKELQEVRERFKTRHNYSHIFMVGVAVHWVSIVIHKVTNSNKESKYEVILMDSRNHNLLGGTEKEFQDIVDSHPETPERLKKGYFLSLRDPRRVVDILTSCIVGEGDLLKTLVELNLHAFLENYYDHVTPLAPSISLHQSINVYDIELVQLVHWLENYWPPSVIEHNICQVVDSIINDCQHQDLHKILDKRISESFSQWIREISKHALHQSDVYLLKRFSLTMEWFNGKFLTCSRLTE